ncbi:hypothetical protein Csa_008648, partial [Cucumis sativus]
MYKPKWNLTTRSRAEALSVEMKKIVSGSAMNQKKNLPQSSKIRNSASKLGEGPNVERTQFLIFGRFSSFPFPLKHSPAPS